MLADPGAGLEHVPPGEDDAIERVISAVQRRLQDDYAAVRPALRAQHPKTHASVRAQLVVRPDVPADLRHGVFARPGAFEARIRFSGSLAPPTPDHDRDAHGISIKVLGVHGDFVPLGGEADHESQDFLLVNSDVFFCRDVATYADFAEAVTSPAGSRSEQLVRRARMIGCFYPPDAPNRRGLRNLWDAVRQPVANSLRIRYWSQTPYLLGTQAVKYSAVPVPRPTRQRRRPLEADGIAAAIARELGAQGVDFEFKVQRQLDPRTMPVEDATVRWDERASPFVTVATLHIPEQDPTLPSAPALGDGLTFTPWHSLRVHRPLGGINRARRASYEAGARLRRAMNGES